MFGLAEKLPKKNPADRRPSRNILNTAWLLLPCFRWGKSQGKQTEQPGAMAAVPVVPGLPGALPPPPEELKNNFFNIGGGDRPTMPPPPMGAPPPASFFYPHQPGPPGAPPPLPPSLPGPAPIHYPSQDPSRMGATQPRHIQQ